jgi:AcrR family transcriptional regulator
MSTANRKQREKNERHQIILDAAQLLFVEQGAEKLNMREVATATELSVGTIYLYFKDKNELLFAIQSRAFSRLAAQFDEIGTILHPADRLIAMNQRYLAFAFEHPELYELLFIMEGPMEAAGERGDACPWATGQAAFQRVVVAVQAGMNTGVFRQRDAESAALMIWAQMHGLASLYLRKRLMFFAAPRQQPLMEQAMNLFNQFISQSL